jgi:hypothetical protein
MEKLTGVPAQLLDTGVTSTRAVTAELLVFTAVNELIFPVPLATRPIEVWLFVQLKLVPAILPLKITAAVPVWLQSV